MPIPQPILPTIMISTDDERRLSLLARASMTQFPRVAHFSRTRLIAPPSCRAPQRHSPHGFSGRVSR